MLNMFRVLVLFVAAGLFVLNAQAAVKTELYSAAVPISSQSERAIGVALRQAFKQVLIKVSGDAQIVESTLIKRAERDVNQYLQQFTFETLSGRLFYQAMFDEDKIKRLILDANFPIWGEFRPTALVWLVHQDDQSNERELLSDSSFSPFKTPMTTIADQRGIWLNFPLLDITDLSQVNLFDVWGRFDNKLLQASQRYGTEGVVVARLFPQKNLLSKDDQVDVPQLLSVEQGTSLWQLDWTLMFEGKRVQRTLSGPVAENLLTDFTTDLVDQFAGFYAVQVNQGDVEYQELSVVVSNIQSLEDFSGVQTLFSSTPFVNRVSLVSVDGNRATYHIHMMGSATDLERNLQLNANIEQVSQSVDEVIEHGKRTSSAVNSFEFVWTPIK